MRKLLIWAVVFLGLFAMAQETRVIVEITNTAVFTKLEPVYEIEFLVFTKDGNPIGEFPIVPPVPIPPGRTERFGPYSLKEEPNDLVIKGTKRTPMTVGPFTVKFEDLESCMPTSHPYEAIRVHLFITWVTPQFPPTVPVPPAPIPPSVPTLGKQAVEEGWSRIRAGIEEAIKAYDPILKGTKINAEAAAFWGSGKRILMVAPADPIVFQPGAIMGIIFMEGEFYAMRLQSIPIGLLELLSLKGEVIKRLRGTIPPELWGKAVSDPKVDIVTYEEPAGPGGLLRIKICIGYHKANCDCSGIYIEIP